MDENKTIHLTLRMPLRRRVEYSIACDLLDANMSKKLHRVISETIATARTLSPDFEKLVLEALNRELEEETPPTQTKIKRKQTPKS